MSLRATNLSRLDGGSFDVLIVGGGINGAVSAAALASRGAKVALVDRGDFAGFTSMQSSNLVWGGFKYLENYEIGLVRHLCRSRNHLLKSYPANLKEIRFLATLDQHSPYPAWFAGMGALGYWLIGNGATKPPRALTRRQVKRADTAINVSHARGGIEYSDAYIVDNDARFSFGFVRAALNVGATCANYVEVASAERSDGWWNVSLRDTDGGAEFSARARVLINAGGPFADELNREHGITTRHRIVLSKGVHLIVPRIARSERILAFFDDTQRLFYVIPMGLRSVIGTTDERVDSPHTEVTPADVEFLLGQINARLTLSNPLTADDVISTRCGVRPLVVEASGPNVDAVDWTALSRKHAIESDSGKGHITIFGGKLTDCLNVGTEVCREAARLGVELEPDRHNWYGEPPTATRDEFFRQAKYMGLDRMRHHASFETLSTRLWRRYGLRAFAMLEAIRDDPSMADDVVEDTEYVRAELFLSAKTEMITKLEDFLRRRSKIALVQRHEDIRHAAGLDEACELLFGPDAERRRAEYFNDPGPTG